MKIKSHVPGAYARLRVFLTGVPIYLCSQMKEDQRSERLSVIVRFEKVLPGKVQIGFLSFNVRSFVPCTVVF